MSEGARTLWSCATCGPHEGSRGNWCAAGCGSDFREMRKVDPDDIWRWRNFFRALPVSERAEVLGFVRADVCRKDGEPWEPPRCDAFCRLERWVENTDG